MLERNMACRNAAVQAALCFIAIRMFRSNECRSLGLIQKELVVQMAKYVVSSYDDPIWEKRKLRSSTKRLKR